MEVPEQASVIARRYQLQSLIGEGGMASVWRARDLTLERPVAVKLLFARDARDKDRLVQQFLREARIAASVHHRNVIHIVDFGTTEEQQPFMVMELLEGETLGQRMGREPPLTLPELIQIASLTLRGLAAVHDAGIIHRDLKPDNVYLHHDPAGGLFPKILDFGISRSIEPRSGRRSALTTREGMIVGTPEYMSPEQARGVRAIDRRTDIYSMGAILYQAFTGRLPFFSENVGDLIIQIVTGVAAPVHELNHTVPHSISDVIAKAMARSPEDRYTGALEMQQALLAAAQEVDSELVRPTLSDMPGPPTPNRSLSAPRGAHPRPGTLEFPMDEGTSGEVELPLRAPLAAPVLESEPAPAQAKNGRAVLLGIVAALFAAVATFLWVSGFPASSRSATGSLPPAQPEAPRVTPAAAPAQPPAPPETGPITISLNNVPPGATITVDGETMPGNVFELPRDARNRVIKVSAKGKAPWQAVHHASASTSYDVWLVDTERRAIRSVRPSQPTIRPTAAAPARPKKPPSALRRLDF